MVTLEGPSHSMLGEGLPLATQVNTAAIPTGALTFCGACVMEGGAKECTTNKINKLIIVRTIGHRKDVWRILDNPPQFLFFKKYQFE